MKIGLVLSGGVAKGAYQAGFLRAVVDSGIVSSIGSISCASIGLFSGYALSAGKVQKLYDIWQQIHFDSFADLTYEVWFKHYLKELMAEFIRTDDMLRIPVYAPICYVLPFIRMEYCKLYGEYIKTWSKFILGATSYPFISGGIHFFRGQITFDGGAMDNIPVFPLIEFERPDLILILHFESGYRPRRKYLLSGIPVFDFDISIADKFRKHSFDFHSDTLQARLKHGYEYGGELINNLFGGCKASIEEVCAAAQRQRESETDRRLDGATFETWVQRLNEIFYPYVSQFKIKMRDLSVHGGVTRLRLNKEVQRYVN